MKNAYSTLAILIRWCVSCVLAVIVAVPAYTSAVSSI